MADPEIAKLAKENGTTRAVASMERGMENHPDAVFAVGNAPTALIRIAEMIEDGARPSLVIGVPVGFVNVVESKEYALSVCEKYGVPGIFAMGRKGGSNGHTGGFATETIGKDGLTGPQRAAIAGAKGGRKSRRGPSKDSIAAYARRFA
jgi:hypothetical protein